VTTQYVVCHSTGAEIGEDSPAYWLAVNHHDDEGAEATGDVWDIALTLEEVIERASAPRHLDTDEWTMVAPEDQHPDPLGAYPLATITINRA